MTEPKTLRAKNPTDLLAAVPYLLGFHPDDSVVLVTLGTSGTPVHARQDLPASADHIPAVVRDLVEVTRRAGVTRAAVVVYSSDEAVADALAGALTRSLRRGRVQVALALRADGERWYCLGEDDGRCRRGCPAEGTPYDLARHPITLEAVVDGRVVHGSRDALRDSLVSDDLDEVERVAAAVDSAGRRLVAACDSSTGLDRVSGRHHLVQEGRWVQNRVGRFLRDGRRLDSHDVGRLVVAVAAVEVRDVAWAQMSRADAERHVDLWRDVVRRSPRDTLAAPAALLAFAAWLSGDGALAWCAVDRSQEAEPGYGLAGLVTQALAGAVPPTTWKPLGAGALSLFAG